MRSIFVLVLTGGLAATGLFACTGTVAGEAGDHSTVQSRVVDSCKELTTVCGSTGQDCSALQAFCGPVQQELAQFFAAEATCKAACADGNTVCLKDCKSTRLTSVQSILAVSDLNHDSIAGDGLTACTELQQTCASSGSGCSATEFFCSIARPAPDACDLEFETCKAGCGTDRACKRACRQAYRQCEQGGTTTPPDAGTTTPDSGTTTPDSGTTTPDAPTTTTPTYTYTKDIMPVTSSYCAGCHGGTSPTQNYSTETYQGLLGGGSDNVPNVIPGDATSELVLHVQGNHKNVLTLYPGFDKVVYTWVVTDLAPQ